jgi:hypothetical protein
MRAIDIKHIYICLFLYFYNKYGPFIDEDILFIVDTPVDENRDQTQREGFGLHFVTMQW